MEPEQVKEVFDYDPSTGLLRWLRNVSRHRAGSVAGSRRSNGRYVAVRFGGRWYQAHRLAFAWMTGRWPDPEVDHRNGDTMDNRWSNLREASRAENARNRKVARTNRTGLKGVIRVTRYGVTKFEARIRIDGKQKHLGRFDSAQEAHQAYIQAAVMYYGSYARG